MSLQEAIDAIQRSGLRDEDKARLSRQLRLLNMHAREMTGEELAEARRAAGLTVGQACALLKTTAHTLISIEGGWDPPDAGFREALLVRMDEVYGLGRS